MAVAEDKKRVFVTFPKEDLEKAKQMADSLGMTLSNYVTMIVRAVNQQDFEKVFQSVVDTLSEQFKRPIT